MASLPDNRPQKSGILAAISRLLGGKPSVPPPPPPPPKPNAPPRASKPDTDPGATAVMIAPVCPKCGAPMVLRTSGSGRMAGKSFYGCKNFPACRETIEP